MIHSVIVCLNHMRIANYRIFEALDSLRPRIWFLAVFFFSLGRSATCRELPRRECLFDVELQCKPGNRKLFPSWGAVTNTFLVASGEASALTWRDVTWRNMTRRVSRASPLTLMSRSAVAGFPRIRRWWLESKYLPGALQKPSLPVLFLASSGFFCASGKDAERGSRCKNCL